MSARYEAVIGMEVHAQILTASKMFCGCSADYAAAPPNTHVCPVCLAMPGVLPVINRRAVEQTVRTGLALNCQISPVAVFARKNYIYPDLPKGYQISQYELPLCRDGWLMIELSDGQQRRIGIRRAHLEEDTGKLIHMDGHSLIDFNRAGVPLLEIVSEPDMRSAEEAYAYVVRLRQILRYLGVSSGDMEKGAMRCEVNVSVRPAGSTQLGTKVEIKNLNSFRAVRLSLEYEINRQIALLEKGEAVEQVTVGWDEARGRTVVQRTKESAHDYRYFPEPDLPPLELSAAWVEALRASLPELPLARRDRLMSAYGLSRQEANLLTDERTVADFFEAAVQAYPGEPRAMANWIMGELFRLLNAAGIEITASQVTPAALAELQTLVDQGVINLNTAKRVLNTMFQTGQTAATIVQAEGLAQVSDQEALAAVITQVLAEHPEEVARYRAGKTTVLSWLMGQVMRATRGQANPQVVRRLLQQALDQE
ncbi:MAG: Asp-tRNA(Asn)/Glu-tRNA(Gln) amidotransferase subunit GatB [Anaerolineae bacterium]|nr:Asp-tRNA(Asn)/Glu-tRNA(Gln) amidotransferase subunit GatB [Anaerolineae bacterium]MDW8098539.1 Asp-tRNA(Asn)/Glu-tRNA(Gln) amidotransferase subunit GatB [Anaerolineae bacterium]